MSPTRHPSTDLLLEHAAGQLPSGQDLVVAAHVAVCEACRAEVRRNEAIGGVILDAEVPAPMDGDALEIALARIEQPATSPAEVAKATPADWIGFDSPAVENAWRRRRWAAPGVWVAPILRGPGKSRTYLLRVAAGMSVPFHRHEGAEFTTVLKGAFDDRGEIHAPGDFAQCGEDVRHRPKVAGDEECVCLICADAPLIALDWVGKLFQPLVRI